LRFFGPVATHIYRRKDWGDEIFALSEEEKLLEGDHVLTVYLDSTDLREKVHSIILSVEEWKGICNCS